MGLAGEHPWLAGSVVTASWVDGGDRPQALARPLLPKEPVGYRVKTALLGKPMLSDQLSHERLSKFLALGVLSSDCISSSAYGTEEMLIVLLPAFALMGFTVLLPLTGVIICVLILVTASYRDVVSVYTKTGGSYVVARENFGPLVAQVAAVALMLDYIVTVAVQSAAGTAALASAFPAISGWSLEITVAVVLVLCFGNLRGIREAGKAFAFPTYFFAGSMAVVIVVGLVRQVMGDLPVFATGGPGTYPVVSSQQSLLAWGSIFILLRAFANGGSSLTGLEAISNGVSVFKKPESVNARKTLVTMSVILGTLVAGVSWLAYSTHAEPYLIGSPTVISQVTEAVFGTSTFGHLLFLMVQMATMLILYTGANTPFSGFPFLVNFVAEDQFLPRKLTRRGHRLAFSNGIIVLTVVAVALLLGTGAHVDKLVAFYAIGVFTGFTLAGFGMAKYYLRHPAGIKRRKVVINFTSGLVSMIVVLVFAVVKFTEGAWLVIIIFPIAVFALFRLNRQYRLEAAALRVVAPEVGNSRISHHSVVVLVDNADLATIAGVRYALSLRAGSLRAVHFTLDQERSNAIAAAWSTQAALATVPLDIIDCPDRRLVNSVVELAAEETADANTELTLVLPRRTYAPFLGRILHDQTADDVARAISKQPRVVATVIPFDVNGLIERRESARQAQDELTRPTPTRQTTPAAHPRRASVPDAIPAQVISPAVSHDVTPVARLEWRHRATVQGKVHAVRLAPMRNAPSLEVDVWDDTGGITLIFYGRRSIAGVNAGATLTASGTVGERRGKLTMSNPIYQLEAKADA